MDQYQYVKGANTTSSSSSSNNNNNKSSNHSNSNEEKPQQQQQQQQQFMPAFRSYRAPVLGDWSHKWNDLAIGHCGETTFKPSSSSSSSASASSASSASSLDKKRKRSASESKDPELGYEPPSAKRQQLLTDDALKGVGVAVGVGVGYASDKSNQSSLYTSPGSEPTLTAQDLLSIRSSPAEELPEAPHSPLPDSPDSPPSPDRGATQLGVVVRYASEQLKDAEDSDADADAEAELLDDSEEYFFHEDDEDEEINSSTISPASSTATGCSQNGERTPATQHLAGGHASVACPSTVCTDALRKLRGPAGADFDGPNSIYKCLSPAAETTLRQCPLPALGWANALDVWKRMCQLDEQDSHKRSSTMLENHPGLQPRMRAILLDWLIEVCEVYKLHRETFYLAVDYLDRYLHVARQVQKTHLQLFGITCLFVAAKVEEIYPPKIGEFAYVTDGACTERDILQHEKLLLSALNWDTCPITPTAWLGVYMQLNVSNRTPASFAQIGRQAQRSAAEPGTAAAAAAATDDAFIYPQFSAYEFVQTSQLLDLCALDVGMANYPYSILAAAAMSHAFDRETALRCSGLDWQAIQPCARWMEPFFNVIATRAPYLQLNEQNEQVTNKFGLAHICPQIVTDDSHIIQTHTTTMDMYDELQMAQNALHAMRARTQASPATALRAPESLLTPPASSHKPDQDNDEDEDEAELELELQQQSSIVTATDNGKASAGSSSSSSARAPLQPLLSHGADGGGGSGGSVGSGCGSRA